MRAFRVFTKVAKLSNAYGRQLRTRFGAIIYALDEGIAELNMIAMLRDFPVPEMDVADLGENPDYPAGLALDQDELWHYVPEFDKDQVKITRVNDPLQDIGWMEHRFPAAIPGTDGEPIPVKYHFIYPKPSAVVYELCGEELNSVGLGIECSTFDNQTTMTFMLRGDGSDDFGVADPTANYNPFEEEDDGGTVLRQGYVGVINDNKVRIFDLGSPTSEKPLPSGAVEMVVPEVLELDSDAQELRAKILEGHKRKGE